MNDFDSFDRLRPNMFERSGTVREGLKRPRSGRKRSWDI